MIELILFCLYFFTPYLSIEGSFVNSILENFPRSSLGYSVYLNLPKPTCSAGIDSERRRGKVPRRKKKEMMIVLIRQGKVVGYKKMEANPTGKGEWCGGGTAAEQPRFTAKPEKPRFTPKPGSLFPKKKRSVKMMIFHYITRSFCFSRSSPDSACNFEPDMGNSCFMTVSKKKGGA